MAPSGESSDGCERLRRAAEDGGPVPAFPLKSSSLCSSFFSVFQLKEMTAECGKEVVTVVRDDFFHDPFFKVSKPKFPRRLKYRCGSFHTDMISYHLGHQLFV